MRTVQRTLLLISVILTTSVGATADERGFAGSLSEGHSGLLQMGARHYDPATGRFLQTDPLGIGADHLYAYGANNPYLFWDPTGLAPQGIADWKSFAAEIHSQDNRSRFDRVMALAYESVMNTLGSRAPDRLYENGACLPGCVNFRTLTAGGFDIGPFQNVGGTESFSINGGNFREARFGVPPVDWVTLPGHSLYTLSGRLSRVYDDVPLGSIFDVVASARTGNIAAVMRDTMTEVPPSWGMLEEVAFALKRPRHFEELVQEYGVDPIIGSAAGRVGATFVNGFDSRLQVSWGSWINAQNPTFVGNEMPALLRPRFQQSLAEHAGTDLWIPSR